MKTSDGSFHYCYNAQSVVDDAHQVIVATRLDNCPSDSPAFEDMLDEVISNCGRPPRQVLADAGYFSGDNSGQQRRSIDPLIATGACATARHHVRTQGTYPQRRDTQRAHGTKARTKRRAAYARRKAIVEPVFGQMDVVQGAKHLLLRGQHAAAAEWDLLSACHNLRKLFVVKGTARSPSPDW